MIHMDQLGDDRADDLRRLEALRNGGSGPLGERLGSLRVVAQAAIDEGLALDPRPAPADGSPRAEVDVGGSEVAQALVSPSVVVMLDEGGNRASSSPGR